MKTWSIKCACMLGALLVSGCADFAAPVDTSCEGAADEGDVLGGLTVVTPRLFPAREDVVLRGTSQHIEGLAIRSITVAGSRAVADPGAFNMDQWTVTIPLDTLLSLPGKDNDDGSKSVELSPVVVDACERNYRLPALSIPVSQEPTTFVTELAMDVLVPGGKTYLPSTLVTPATVRLIANKEAVGANVLVKASMGQFVDTMNSEAVLTFQSDGDRAVATTLFTSDMPGTAVFTASSDVSLATATARVLGPFAMAPQGATLRKGQEVEVVLVGDGTFASQEACIATPVSGVTVTSGGEDLMRSGTLQNGRFRVGVDAALAEDTSVTVTCRDVYGQISVGVFDAVAME